jgi:exocyst complex component 1
MSLFSRQAEAIYDENLSAYIKLVIRRPFGRIIVRCGEA